MNQLALDVRYGARLLLKSPLATAAAVLSLALGIGGTTAMFSIGDAVLLRPLPYPHPNRLIMVRATSKFGSGKLAPADFLDYRRYVGSVEGLASLMGSSMSLT